ncbi:hypothetical protein ABIA06_003344 [Bradyrhizobium yuanmingense]
MNVDPGNAADTPFEAHNPLQEPRQVHGPQDELNSQISAPAYSTDDQESFEQHLNDLNLDDVDSLNPTSALLPFVASSASARSSSAPGEAASETSRYPALSFAGARIACGNADGRHGPRAQERDRPRRKAISAMGASGSQRRRPGSHLRQYKRTRHISRRIVSRTRTAIANRARKPPHLQYHTSVTPREIILPLVILWSGTPWAWLARLDDICAVRPLLHSWPWQKSIETQRFP